MGNFKNVSVGGATGIKQSRMSLEYVDDSFLLQVIEEPERRGAMLDLVLTTREEPVGMQGSKAA